MIRIPGPALRAVKTKSTKGRQDENEDRRQLKFHISYFIFEA